MPRGPVLRTDQKITGGVAGLLLCERRGQISPTVWFLPEQAKERFVFATNTVTKTKIVSEQRGAGRSTGSADASVHEVTGPEAQHRVPLTDPQRESADAQPTPRTAFSCRSSCGSHRLPHQPGRPGTLTR